MVDLVRLTFRECYARALPGSRCLPGEGSALAGETVRGFVFLGIIADEKARRIWATCFERVAKQQ
mgnify:CR=1 FL=1